MSSKSSEWDDREKHGPTPLDRQPVPRFPLPLRPIRPLSEQEKRIAVRADLIVLGCAQIIAYLIADRDEDGLIELSGELKAYWQGKVKEKEGFQQ
jgi:hypothetical protein